MKSVDLVVFALLKLCVGMLTTTRALTKLHSLRLRRNYAITTHFHTKPLPAAREALSTIHTKLSPVHAIEANDVLLAWKEAAACTLMFPFMTLAVIGAFNTGRIDGVKAREMILTSTLITMIAWIFSPLLTLSYPFFKCGVIVRYGLFHIYKPNLSIKSLGENPKDFVKRLALIDKPVDTLKLAQSRLSLDAAAFLFKAHKHKISYSQAHRQAFDALSRDFRVCRM